MRCNKWLVLKTSSIRATWGARILKRRIPKRGIRIGNQSFDTNHTVVRGIFIFNFFLKEMREPMHVREFLAHKDGQISLS